MNRMSNSSRGIVRVIFIALLVSIFPSTNTTADVPFDMQQYRGKVLLLDFWASWCVPCRRSFPWMNEMHKKYEGQGLVIVGVNMDAEAADAEKFLHEFPAEFQIIEDPNGELAKKFDVVAMPSSYVINRDGDVVKRHLGFKVKRQDEYELLIQSVLADK